MTRLISVLVVLCSCIWQESLSDLVSKTVKPWANDPICGIPKYAPRTEGRVVGGDAANPHSWPWRVMLICSSQKSSKSSICGGSIISSKWILTAAHCVNSQVHNISWECTVYLGRHYLPTHQSSVEATEQSFRIVHHVIHDFYNASHLESGNDLALVKLSREIRYTKEILPICLPFDQDELTETSVCYSGGWGYTEGPTTKPQYYHLSTGHQAVFRLSNIRTIELSDYKHRTDLNSAEGKQSISQVLKQIRLPIQTGGYCSFTRKAAEFGIIICAGKWDREQNLCYGDSGGPLECKTDSKWYLHGVLSQVDKNCVSVASFAKVKMFREWIESNT